MLNDPVVSGGTFSPPPPPQSFAAVHSPTVAVASPSSTFAPVNGGSVMLQQQQQTRMQQIPHSTTLPRNMGSSGHPNNNGRPPRPLSQHQPLTSIRQLQQHNGNGGGNSISEAAAGEEDSSSYSFQELSPPSSVSGGVTVGNRPNGDAMRINGRNPSAAAAAAAAAIGATMPRGGPAAAAVANGHNSKSRKSVTIGTFTTVEPPFDANYSSAV